MNNDARKSSRNQRSPKDVEAFIEQLLAAMKAIDEPRMTRSSTNMRAVSIDAECALWKVSGALDGLAEIAARGSTGEGDLRGVGCENMAYLLDVISDSLKQAMAVVEAKLCASAQQDEGKPGT